MWKARRFAGAFVPSQLTDNRGQCSNPAMGLYACVRAFGRSSLTLKVPRVLFAEGCDTFLV